MSVCKSLNLALILFFMVSLPVAAEEEEEEEISAPARDFRHAINLSPMSLGSGTLALNYEYLLKGYHGLVLEGAVTPFGVSKGSYAAGASYRIHWLGRMESGFVGPFVRYSESEGALEQKVEGEMQKFEFGASALTLGANVGKKWQWNNGIGIAFRIGYGYVFHDIEWEPNEPKDNVVVDILPWVLGLDLEASLGWAF